MARPRYARDHGPRPEALPPEDRPVGQLVAEALKLYGRRFWVSLPTGLGLALVDQLFRDQPVWVWLAGAPPILAAAFVAASVIALPRRPGLRPLAVAFAAGVLVLLPFPFLFALFVLPAIVWLALVSLAVPAAVTEGTTLPASFARGFRLARADLAHAVGGIAALALTYFFTRFALVLLLKGTGDQTERAAVFLADLVLGPVVFLGAALLYVDQAARVEAAERQSGSASSGRHRKGSLRIGSPSRRRRDADVRDAVDPDPAGRADAEVQP
jgi:hypothetical protein